MCLSVVSQVAGRRGVWRASEGTRPNSIRGATSTIAQRIPVKPAAAGASRQGVERSTGGAQVSEPGDRARLHSAHACLLYAHARVNALAVRHGRTAPSWREHSAAGVSYYPRPSAVQHRPQYLAGTDSGCARPGAAPAVLLEQASAGTGVAAGEVGAPNGRRAAAVAATGEDPGGAWALPRAGRRAACSGVRCAPAAPAVAARPCLVAQAAAADLSPSQLGRARPVLAPARARAAKDTPAAGALGQLAEHGQPAVDLARRDHCRPSHARRDPVAAQGPGNGRRAAAELRRDRVRRQPLQLIPLAQPTGVLQLREARRHRRQGLARQHALPPDSGRPGQYQEFCGSGHRPSDGAVPCHPGADVPRPFGRLATRTDVAQKSLLRPLRAARQEAGSVGKMA
jgi:hypothetical protein